MNLAHLEQFPNILVLMDLIMTLPVQSAVCERGFNRMKGVKSDWLSKLREDALNDQLRIIFDSPDIENFNPTEAITCGTLQVPDRDVHNLSHMAPRMMLQMIMNHHQTPKCLIQNCELQDIMSCENRLSL